MFVQNSTVISLLCAGSKLFILQAIASCLCASNAITYVPTSLLDEKILHASLVQTLPSVLPLGRKNLSNRVSSLPIRDSPRNSSQNAVKCVPKMSTSPAVYYRIGKGRREGQNFYQGIEEALL